MIKLVPPSQSNEPLPVFQSHLANWKIVQFEIENKITHTLPQIYYAHLQPDELYIFCNALNRRIAEYGIVYYVEVV